MGDSTKGAADYRVGRVRPTLVSVLEQVSTVAPLDILGSFGIAWIEEEILRFRMFNQLTEQHEDTLVARPPCLGHIVSDDHHRVSPL